MLKAISRLAGNFAKSPFSKRLIAAYAAFYKIDTSEAEKSLNEYQSLSDFFTRSLRPGLRPFNPNSLKIISPVDGCISQIGKIDKGQLIQAKGINYTVLALLGNNQAKAEKYNSGTFITIYLSPKDYHRIHIPLSGTISEYVYIPGNLFPVNALGVQSVKGLFSRNERLITYLQTAAGEIAVVKVGAVIVGSVKVVYDREITTNVKQCNIVRKTLPTSYPASKGDELGHFDFGSTVILLFEPNKIKLNPDLYPGCPVKMGMEIGEVVRD